jgi:hypothetical protein
MLNFFVKSEDDTRTLLRFSLVGDRAHELDLDGPQAQGFLILSCVQRYRSYPVEPGH